MPTSKKKGTTVKTGTGRLPAASMAKRSPTKGGVAPKKPQKPLR